MSDSIFELTGFTTEASGFFTDIAAELQRQRSGKSISPSVHYHDNSKPGKINTSAKNNLVHRKEQSLDKKCWDHLAKEILPKHCQIKNQKEDEMSVMITKLLRQSDECGVPSNVIDSIVAISRRLNSTSLGSWRSDAAPSCTNEKVKAVDHDTTRQHVSNVKAFLNSSHSKEGKLVVLRLLTFVLDIPRARESSNWDKDSLQHSLDDDVSEDQINGIFKRINNACFQDDFSRCSGVRSSPLSSNLCHSRPSMRDAHIEGNNAYCFPSTNVFDKEMAKDQHEKPHSRLEATDDGVSLHKNDERHYLDPVRLSQRKPAEIYGDLKRTLSMNQGKDSSNHGSDWGDEIKESPVTFVGDNVSTAISKGAKWIEKSLASSVVPAVNSGIETAGTFAKKNIEEEKEEEEEESFIPDQKVELAVLEYSDKIKGATGKIRETAHTVRFGIRDVSTRGINKVAQKLEENDVSSQLCPDEGLRNFFAAGGKIGLATLGGAAIVAEALYETTKAVAQKGTEVTADVVRHKYGDAAGRLVEDTGEATGNILRTITHIAAVEGKVMAEAVVKNTGRVHIVGEVDGTNAFRIHESNEAELAPAEVLSAKTSTNASTNVSDKNTELVDCSDTIIDSSSASDNKELDAYEIESNMDVCDAKV